MHEREKKKKSIKTLLISMHFYAVKTLLLSSQKHSWKHILAFTLKLKYWGVTLHAGTREVGGSLHSQREDDMQDRATLSTNLHIKNTCFMLYGCSWYSCQLTFLDNLKTKWILKPWALFCCGWWDVSGFQEENLIIWVFSLGLYTSHRCSFIKATANCRTKH